MSFSALLVLVVFSGAVVFLLLWSAAYLLKRVGIDLSHAPARVYEKAEKVIAKVEYFSEYDGWHVVFNRGFGTCYGILANLSKGQTEKDVVLEAAIIAEPNRDCGFYELLVE